MPKGYFTQFTKDQEDKIKESVLLKNSLMDFLKEINTGDITDEKIKKGKLIYDVSTSIVNIQKAEIALINAVKK